MKKLIFIFCILFSFNTMATEIYSCKSLSGYTTPLKKNEKEITKTETISDFKIVVDGKNSYILTPDNQKTPLLLFNETDEKAELLEIGTVASSIYSIDKKTKKILQAKNGIVPEDFSELLDIEIPYQIIMSGVCK